MGKWVVLLGGLTIWLAHFLLLYAFASIFPGRDLARVLSLLATIPALAGCALLLWHAARTSSDDPFDRWVHNVGALGAAVAVVAVLWQALPALVV